MIVTGKTPSNGGYTLNIRPDYNEDNSAWTPEFTTTTGSLDIVVSSSVASQFSYGQKVLVTLEPGEQTLSAQERAQYEPGGVEDAEEQKPSEGVDVRDEEDEGRKRAS